MPSAPSGSTQTLSGKNHHSKDDHPSCAVDGRGSRVCRNLVLSSGDRLLDLSVTETTAACHLYLPHAYTSLEDFSSLFEG